MYIHNNLSKRNSYFELYFMESLARRFDRQVILQVTEKHMDR